MTINHTSDETCAFNPGDHSRVKHTKVGVWDLYEDIPRKLDHVPGASSIEKILEMKQDLPYLWRMLADIASIKSCWFLLGTYTFLCFLIDAILPAVSLWFSGQMLIIVQTVVDTRAVDKSLLLRIVAGTMCCSVSQSLLSFWSHKINVPLEQRLNQHFDQHLFRARARLDLPTYEDPVIQHQLAGVTPSNGRSIAVTTVYITTGVMQACLYVIGQFAVMFHVFREQPDALLLALFMLAALLMQQAGGRFGGVITARVWAATTKNEDYLRKQGSKRIVYNSGHRKEMIAGNLVQYLVAQFVAASKRLGEDEGDFAELASSWRNHRSNWHLVSTIMRSFDLLPQVLFILNAARLPASIPVSIASIRLIQQSLHTFAWELHSIYDNIQGLSKQLTDVRKLYDVAEIPNRIQDGDKPFPEDTQKIAAGISLEFINVSFRYPGSDTYALRGVSFKLLAGQLCIIVGSNGSGKSTILKLITRLYDPEEGEILLDGRNIRTLRLYDLRQAISVLFQDYTLFPLSIRDNIGLGDPEHACDKERIERAAELGGASEFIARLPEGLDTYLERPVKDHYGDLPAGTHTLFGRRVDYNGLRGAGEMSSTAQIGLSGGQMQRLAVARSFMRSIVSDEQKVGLLLFDEPSASLDPTAEHDLFVRLRALRGNKTMVFSSHRFGSLTRHADMILYMSNSAILESGNHEQLLARDGEYARLWKLQAQAFL
ncbi:P-loop containing nucleoside triphosphate hydrolase protein [Obba rivulosa]|uniref:P-loop containing nucleoside triphosphate hydrolase protein n=1 Tax=Obba rivulosa TaxID=1052685 RepID=A0A8E2DH04_9APHY|nr:P-loop containing nucleoside triphosphate hydrolase protein [Obba rivulosa]